MPAQLQPIYVIERGRFTVRDFSVPLGLHGHQYNVFSEVLIDGKPYLPFGSKPRACTLEPSADPRAAILSLSGDHAGLYLLRLTDAGVVLDLLVDKPTFAGLSRFTSESRYYVWDQEAIHTRTGERRRLPPYPGQFWSFSPDERRLLSVTFESPQALTLHLIDMVTGEAEHTPVKRSEYPWLEEGKVTLWGFAGSSHLSKAAQLQWVKERGRYRIALPPRQ